MTAEMAYRRYRARPQSRPASRLIYFSADGHLRHVSWSEQRGFFCSWVSTLCEKVSALCRRSSPLDCWLGVSRKKSGIRTEPSDAIIRRGGVGDEGRLFKKPWAVSFVHD